MLRNDLAAVGLVILVSAPAPAVTNNGFDTNWILVLREVNGGAAYPDGEIRKIDENLIYPRVDSTGDLGRFGSAAASLAADGRPKSICFSNAPSAGVNSPAGARLFGVEPTGVPINAAAQSSNHNPNNVTTGFTVWEFDSTGAKIRQFQPGLVLGTGDRRAITYPIPGTPSDADPTGQYYYDPIRLGTIRYNPARNTLAVSCNVVSHVNTPQETDKGMVYEFDLPDWVATTSVKTSAADVHLVQVYEMPSPHNIQGDNGNIDNGPLGIDFDDQGNMYCTSSFFNATMDLDMINAAQVQNPGNYFGDVIRFSTLGRNGGTSVYVVPVTGANASNLIIQAHNQELLAHTEYAAAWGMSVRPQNNELVMVPRSACATGLYINIFDLTQTVGGAYPTELVRTKALIINGDVQDLPRQGDWAQRDYESGRIYITNQLGSCSPPGGPQNFMYLANDSPTDTLIKDVGFTLNPAASGSCGSNCTLNRTWDAASPPPLPGEAPVGACCQSGHACASLTHADCNAAGGAWQGAGTTCGQYPCEGACCSGPCQACVQSIYYQCTGTGKTFHSLGSLCAEITCPVLCAVPPVDGDCDGDADLADFANFQLCYNPGGPIPSAPSNCACFDRVAPLGEINNLDFDAFANCANGSRALVPALAPCP